MKKYRNSLKRAAAFALSAMLVVSGAAVSAEDFTSFEENAVFAEDPSFVNEGSDIPSADEAAFENMDLYSETADFVSEDTVYETAGTEDASYEEPLDVLAAEESINGESTDGIIEESFDADELIKDISSAEGTYAAAAANESISYLKRSWDHYTEQLETTTAECTNYTVISGKTVRLNGWYVVKDRISLDDRLIVTNTANIILCDGARLYCKDGIQVRGGTTLNIYCQEGESGELYCDADTNDNAAIGADDEDGDCGTVNIYGGKITADAENLGTEGAGIGGGDEGDGGNVTIYGGTVKAIGAKFAAGIGGGDADNEGGRGGTTIIYGGNVTAIGGTDAAGIG
ncbi:MAG: hypothetical protein Q4G47_07540, partial [Lachnospiraceae bacterium]|nr:hypothetical protein [Lachnospiraceae bacterium]